MPINEDVHTLNRPHRMETSGTNGISRKNRTKKTPSALSFLSFRKYILTNVSHDIAKNDQFHLGSLEAESTTVLHLAIECQLYDIIKILLEDGADPDIYNENGQTPLHLAIVNGDAKAVDMLLARDVNEPTLPRCKQYRPIIKRRLLNVNQKEMYSWDTCLCMSLRQGDNDITEMLLDRGADVNLFNGFYQCPLILACKSNKVQIVERLVSAGAKLDVFGCVSGNRQTPLGIAAKYNYPDVARTLVKHGADVNLGDDIGPCPLAVAAGYDSTDVINFLLEVPTVQGLDINLLADNGDTILHTVINCKGDTRLELVWKLALLGANVNQSNKLKHYPLHDAIHLEDIEMTSLLLDLGANLYKRDSLGNNALHICTLFGHLEIAKLLIARGIDVNQKNLKNETPFCLAINCCNFHMIDLFIDCGSDLSLEPYLFQENIKQLVLPDLLQDRRDILQFFVQLARVPRNLYDICLHTVRGHLVGKGSCLSASKIDRLHIPSVLRDDLVFRHLGYV